MDVRPAGGGERLSPARGNLERGLCNSLAAAVPAARVSLVSADAVSKIFHGA